MSTNNGTRNNKRGYLYNCLTCSIYCFFLGQFNIVNASDTMHYDTNFRVMVTWRTSLGYGATNDSFACSDSACESCDHQSGVGPAASCGKTCDETDNTQCEHLDHAPPSHGECLHRNSSNLRRSYSYNKELGGCSSEDVCADAIASFDVSSQQFYQDFPDEPIPTEFCLQGCAVSLYADDSMESTVNRLTVVTKTGQTGRPSQCTPYTASISSSNIRQFDNGDYDQADEYCYRVATDIFNCIDVKTEQDSTHQTVEVLSRSATDVTEPSDMYGDSVPDEILSSELVPVPNGNCVAISEVSSICDDGVTGEGQQQGSISITRRDGTTNTFNYYSTSTISNYDGDSSGSGGTGGTGTGGTGGTGTGGTGTGGTGTGGTGTGGTGTGGEGGSTGSASSDCDVPPVCSDDSVECAILLQAHHAMCPDIDVESILTELGLDAEEQEGEALGFVDQSKFITGSCLADKSYALPIGGSIVLPWSVLCEFFVLIGVLLPLMTLIASARWFSI